MCIIGPLNLSIIAKAIGTAITISTPTKTPNKVRNVLESPPAFFFK